MSESNQCAAAATSYNKKRKLPLCFYHDDDTKALSLIALCQQQLKNLSWHEYMLQVLYYSKRHPEVDFKHLLKILTQPLLLQSLDIITSKKHRDSVDFDIDETFDYSHYVTVYHKTTCRVRNIPFSVQVSLDCEIQDIVVDCKILFYPH